MDPGRYVGLKLLEVECGFPSYFDAELEHYYTCLDEEYNSYLRTQALIEDLSGATLVQVKENYINLLCSIANSPPQFNSDTVYDAFMLTRDYIRYYQMQRNGLYAVALCYWLGNFIDKCNIDWTLRENHIYDKGTRLANYVTQSVFSTVRRLFGF